MRLIDFIERDYRHMSEVTFEIVEHLGVLSEDTKGWQKEVNIVIWNGGAPKVDIRSWDPDHERMSRGITLTMGEADNLAVILDSGLRRMNRYYKAEDVISFLNTHCPKDMWEYQIAGLPTIEVSEDCIDRYSALAELDPRSYEYKAVKELPSVIPKAKEVIYGNEHNCIMTLFGECSYSETGCGDCAVVEKVRDALSKTQMKTQSSNEKPKEGEWIYVTVDEWLRTGRAYGHHCSECDEVNESGRSNFCPNCGAKMKGAWNA